MGYVSRWAWGLAVALVVASTLYGTRPQQHNQNHAAAQASESAAGANPEDVKSMNHILAAMYDVISGPAGQKRNWDRLRSLCVPGARLIAVGHGPNGDVITHAFTLDEYIARATPVLEKEGFFETEIARRTEQFNHIAQVFSTYESRHAENEKPFQRGINGVQLLNDGHRWWIVSVFWEAETKGHELPRKYLHY